MAMRLVREDEDEQPLQIPDEVRRRYEEARLKFGGKNNAAHRPDEDIQQVVDMIVDELRKHAIEPSPLLPDLLFDLSRQT